MDISQIGQSGKIYLLIGILLLLALSFFSARIGLSYICQYRVSAAMETWSNDQGVQPSLTVWKEMRDSVEQRLDVDKNNANLHLVLGRLYYYRATSMGEPRELVVGLLNRAMQEYRTVMTLRPAWPYGYLNLLFAKLVAQQFDAEVGALLHRLIQLGPWEKTSLPGIVNAAIFAWPYLGKTDQNEIKPYLRLAAKQRKNEVHKVLQSAYLRKNFCQSIFAGERMALCM